MHTIYYNSYIIASKETQENNDDLMTIIWLFVSILLIGIVMLVMVCMIRCHKNRTINAQKGIHNVNDIELMDDSHNIENNILEMSVPRMKTQSNQTPIIIENINVNLTHDSTLFIEGETIHQNYEVQAQMMEGGEGMIEPQQQTAGNCNFNFNDYETWTQQQCIEWLRTQFIQNGFKTDDFQSFLKQWQNNQINGKVLSHMKQNSSIMDKVAKKFENFEIGFWIVVETALRDIDNENANTETPN